MNQKWSNKLFCCSVLYLICEIAYACTNLQWSCNNGSCIGLKNLCDGAKDCGDNSDETANFCKNLTCPEYAFRCGYGACVDSSVKCDGFMDCADNSDEDPRHCVSIADRFSAFTGNNIVPQIQNTLRIPSKEPSALILFFNTKADVLKRKNNSKANNRRRCRLDLEPNVLARYKNRAGELQLGQEVRHGSSITYKCRAQHQVEGPNANLCINGTWYNEHPKCFRYCSSILITGTTIKTKCVVDGAEVSCHDSVLLPGTQAFISCQVGYHKPAGEFPEVLTCGENGDWDHRPVACEQICGTLEEGNNTNYLAPWYASIFEVDNYNPICGGTIINARVVLAAAHCFWDAKSDVIKSVKSIFVVLSSQFFFHTRNKFRLREFEQLYDLVEIFIPPGFREGSWIFNSDLAILVLDQYIDFKPYIKPACLDWELTSKHPLVPNVVGRIAGLITKEHKTVLEIREMPVASFDECSAATDPKYTYPFTGDKFCIKKNNEKNTCRLYDGGGFLTEYQNVFYLRGILSHSVNFKDVCSEHPYVAVTDIQFFSTYIIEYDIRFRPRL